MCVDGSKGWICASVHPLDLEFVRVVRFDQL